MDDLRFGQLVRRVRLRSQLRQSDVAGRAGVSQSMVSRIERGHLAGIPLATLRRVCAVLEIRVDVVPRWRGADLDRLINARHSALHEAVAQHFASVPDWLFQPEVSFSIWGERGVVDILAFHPKRKALLVIELKTEIVDVNELVGTLDRKVRLAREVAAKRGWTIPADTTVSAWVIVLEGRTNRRRVQDHAAMLRAAPPADGRAVAGWLVRPRRPLRCLSFWPDSRPGNVGASGTRASGQIGKH
jgi:transcriptional regulator with XRE-family HTH domain